MFPRRLKSLLVLIKEFGKNNHKIMKEIKKKVKGAKENPSGIENPKPKLQIIQKVYSIVYPSGTGRLNLLNRLAKVVANLDIISQRFKHCQNLFTGEQLASRFMSSPHNERFLF